MSEIDHDQIFNNIDDVDLETLKNAYKDLCQINIDVQETYNKLRKEKSQLQKKFETLLELYTIDKTVLKYNNVELVENEDTETIDKLCKRLKINVKINEKKKIPKKVSKNIEKQIKAVYKEPSLKDKLYMYTKNIKGLIQAHLICKKNKDIYIEKQFINPEDILFTTSITMELNDKIIKQIYNEKIISSSDTLIFYENEDDRFKERYIEIFNELNDENKFILDLN